MIFCLPASTTNLVKEIWNPSPRMEILSFLTRLTEGNNQTTKRNRYSGLKAFFNYIRNTIDFEIKNPCDTPILRKIFREKRPQQWKIIEKDLIDEIIFKTDWPRVECVSVKC
jgi:hypothetical protein